MPERRLMFPGSRRRFVRGYARSEHDSAHDNAARPLVVGRRGRRCLAQSVRSVGGVVLVHDVGRDAAAVRDLETLAAGPFTDLGTAVATGAARTDSTPCSPSANPTTGSDVLREVVPEFVGVLRRQVDLVADTFQRELHRLIG